MAVRIGKVNWTCGPARGSCGGCACRDAPRRRAGAFAAIGGMIAGGVSAARLVGSGSDDAARGGRITAGGRDFSFNAALKIPAGA
ncbi:hypothetical protein [Burkholderia thailandensis]|nr:hypothetical protein [Burkholderia thailandensis]